MSRLPTGSRPSLQRRLETTVLLVMTKDLKTKIGLTLIYAKHQAEDPTFFSPRREKAKPAGIKAGFLKFQFCNWISKTEVNHQDKQGKFSCFPALDLTLHTWVMPNMPSVTFIKWRSFYPNKARFSGGPRYLSTALHYILKLHGVLLQYLKFCVKNYNSDGLQKIVTRKQAKETRRRCLVAKTPY